MIDERHNGYKPGQKHPTDLDWTKVRQEEIMFMNTMKIFIHFIIKITTSVFFDLSRYYPVITLSCNNIKYKKFNISIFKLNIKYKNLRTVQYKHIQTFPTWLCVLDYGEMFQCLFLHNIFVFLFSDPGWRV